MDAGTHEVSGWRIELLGGLRAVQGDRVVTRFRTQKTSLLLAYLAFHTAPGSSSPRLFRREQLMELLWPEVERRAGLNHLKATLRWLRQELEPPGVPFGAVLRADRTFIGLDPTAVTTDVAEFAAALEAAARAATSTERVAQIARAVELYRGELLPGCYEDWILQEREWLAERFFQALGQQIGHLQRAGELERALEYARRGVSADPLREEAHRDLIRLQAALGQPGAALRQYEELERLLARDLGDEPSTGVRALAATLRKQLSVASTLAASEPAPQPGALISGSNLPLPLDRFFGRRSALARLVALLRPLTTGAAGDEEQLKESAPPRLVTLTGPGGSGKTRLALEVARRLQPRSRAPIWFVPLQGLTPSTSTDSGARRPPILEEVRDALRLPRTPGSDPLEQVVTALGQQRALLILDNFEHLVEGGAPLVQALLQRVPTLRILVASRQRLNLPGEQEVPVLPLPVPWVSDGHPWIPEDTIEASVSSTEPPACNQQLLTNPSVQLFVDRARAARPDFLLTPRNAAEIARLCARLEGIPLAIELAAGRAGGLTPGQMLERLSDPFTLLVNRRRGVEERHRSLRATLDWSYHLLSPELQQFFSRLSIFRGGWTLAAAAEVCATTEALENLEQLRECSLIVVEEVKGEIRYRLLETLREYGAERLALGEQEALAERHAAFFRDLAEGAELRIRSHERYIWLERLQKELDNFRAALAWCLNSTSRQKDLVERSALPPEQLIEGLRLASALGDYWQYSGHAGEGRDWLDRLLERAAEVGHIALRAKAVDALARLAASQYDDALPLQEESVALWREVGDPAGLARSLCDLGLGKVYSGDLEQARMLLEECVSLLRKSEDRWLLTMALDNQGRLEQFEGNLVQAQATLEEARSLNPGVGAESILSSTLYRLAAVAEASGRLEEARELYTQSMAVTSKLPAADHSCALRELGHLARLRGDYTEARVRLEECVKLRQRLGHSASYLAHAQCQVAEVALIQGDYAAATSFAEQCLARLDPATDPRSFAQALRVLGRVAYQQGELNQARKRLEEALSCTGERGHCLVSIDLAEALAGVGECAQARALFAQSLAALRLSRNYLGLSHLLRAQGRVELRQGEWQQAAPSYRESLSLLQERSVREGVPDCLEGLAAVALASGVGEAARPAGGQPAMCEKQGYRLLGVSGRTAGARLAARLLGAAEALREAMGAPLPPVYRSEHERVVACLSAVLGEQDLMRAWAEGRTMAPEQAMAEALDETRA